ncbi:MAG: hypothetical protein MK207_13250 [Saprospiraceae bacterium]|nr:hypothetical protein [Saprospiraceae bacterium]
MNSIILTKSWKVFITEVFRSPQSYIFWLVVFLFVLFLLSRFRNRMEERGVNKAIYISRGLVGSLIAFIIAPIVFYIMLNIVALVHNVAIIDVSFLTDWIGLTISSYWWLLKCFFGSVSVSFAKEIYSVNSIIRILWIILPISFIWLRMSKTKIGKLFLIPLIIGVLVITRYKTAPTTFITEDKELVKHIPLLNRFALNQNDADINTTQILSVQHKQLITIGLFAVIAIGLVVGLIFKYRVIGLFISLIGLLGFILIAPHDIELNNKHPDYLIDIDSLVSRMDSLYFINGESIDVYQISLQIESAFNARIEAGDMIQFPDSLCTKYEAYFFDRCHNEN